MSVGIVVGATGGIGAAAARALAGGVEELILVGRRRAALDEVAAVVGDGATVVCADLTDAGERDAIARAVSGPLSTVVIASGVPLRTPLSAATTEEIVATFEANLVAPCLLLRRLLDVEWATPGRVVIVGSISASRTLPDRAVYSASKAGLEHLGRSLAAELAPRQIAVNVVAPGVIDTPFLGDARDALDDWIEGHVPARRAGVAEEVAEVLRFLALQAPAYMTGARVVIDGGVEARA
jgi:3-oxoacyl-[acyl-carrier protein] reductase